MRDGTHSELIALVSRVRNEAVLLLEGLYERYPELRPVDDGLGVKVIDRNGMSHDELGRFDGGGYARGIYRFPPEGILPGIELARPVQQGDFESAFDWKEMTLGKWPEIESQAYQAGKVDAIKELDSFTQPGQNEHARVILKESGGIESRAEGTNVRVSARVPFGQSGALVHTHDYEGAHSSTDWSHLLVYAEEEQSHVLTQNSIYSLHKPKGWRAEDYNLLTATANDTAQQIIAKRNAIEAICRVEESRYMTQGFMVGEEGWEKKLSLHIAQKMASRYNIVFRIGKRKRNDPMNKKNVENADSQDENVERDNAAFGHNLYLGGDPLIRKVRAEIEFAKANAVATDDEEMAAKRVDAWVKSQLPRIFREIEEETARGDYLA